MEYKHSIPEIEEVAKTEQYEPQILTKIYLKIDVIYTRMITKKKAQMRHLVSGSFEGL